MRKIDRLIVTGGLTAGLLLTGVTGCASWQEKKAKETGRTAAQLETDNRISDLVKQSLDTAPVYKFPGVGVTTYRNTVQLNGFVATEDQKKAAAEVAQHVPGVNRVINDIAVVPQTLEPTGRNNQQLNQNLNNERYQAPQVSPPPEVIPGNPSGQNTRTNQNTSTQPNETNPPQ